MKQPINLLLLLLLNGTVFSQVFPKPITELYPYHNDPTTVFWRAEQPCRPENISRYIISSNGDSFLNNYQRSISNTFNASNNSRTIHVYYQASGYPSKSYKHIYDSLGRMSYYIASQQNAANFNLSFHYRGNTPWLDSMFTIGSTFKRDIFHYDQNERLTSTDHYYRDMSNAPWTKSGFETWIYDVNGQLSQIEVYTSQPSENLTQVMDINYDNTNRISTIIITNAITDVLSKKYAYTYNDADSISTQVLYYWYNGDWKWDGEKSIDLGYMNRIDAVNNNPGSGTINSRLTMKYAPGETCPYACFEDWLNLNQHYRLYFSYPTTGTGEPGEEDIPLSVYPNPGDGIFWVESPVESRLVLQDMLGRVIWQGASTGKDQLVLPGGANGQFLLHATLDNRTAVRMVLIH